MRSNCAVLFTILLLGVVSLAGCTGSPPAPVATPTPLPVVTFPAIPTPSTTAPVIATYVWPATETLATAATPTPIPVVTFPRITSPAPLATTAPITTTQVWPTLETPAPAHPAAKTYFFHGTGDYEDFTFTTDFDATWEFRMDPGAGTFLVSLQDARGNEIERLPPTGTKTVWLKAGDYHFDIAADAPWYITMSTA